MISNINEAIDTIRHTSDYANVKILEKREGMIADEHFYGFYVTNNHDLKDSETDPFGFGLLVSGNGNVDLLADMMSVKLLDLLDEVK